MLRRPRRNRKTVAIRSMVEETILRPSDFVAPFFVLPGEKKKEAIISLPGVDRLSIDHILKEAEKLHRQGVPAIALFPVLDPSEKDPQGSGALREDGVIPQSVRKLKQEIPSLCVIADIALDPFTSHGHDGIVDAQGYVLNDATIDILTQMAHLFAASGIDFVAPSDMMDGRVAAIRRKLDTHQFHDVGILSYTAKYASSLYAPFRDAVGSKLQFGDKKTYQLNPANSREALLETTLDTEEGADILMVKPALFYLDILAKMRAHSHLPIAAYHVSGEYAMVMAAHEKGYLDAPQVFYEAFLSIKRAGADLIFTYALPHILPQLS
jgi:porphobilinogen synthase